MTHYSRIAIGAGVLLVVATVIAAALGLERTRGGKVALSAPPLDQLPGLPVQAPVLGTEPAIDADDARARNAGDPFFSGTVAPAPPFRFSGSPQDFDRARECLALAALAEAGGADMGQRAVQQVVLNRVRHPAFAKTVCGVVFEGADRQTGCQFSFTCDGSLARRYSDEAWAEARQRADEALRGAVFKPVGNATHYHTDWVYPAWSSHLVKLAQVDTHLFFRWPGFWGTPAAMRIGYRGGEPGLITPEAGGRAAVAAPLPSFAPLPPDTPKVAGGRVAVRDPSGRGNFILLGGANADQALANARKLCGTLATCRVMGWTDPALIPAAFPLSAAARAGLQFSYSRDPEGREIVLYDCHFFTRQAAERCIPRAR